MNRVEKLDENHNEVETVAIRTLDSLGIQHAGFIKIDVEGCELEVLKGSVDTILRCKPVVMVEVFESNKDDVDGLMKGLGYRNFITLEDYNCIYVPE